MNVARRIIAAHEAGNRVVVVLSAQGHTTDRLTEKAYELNPEASRRELDMLLVTGEQQSVALMAMAIQKLGFQAVSLNAPQVGIKASDNYGNALIEEIATERMVTELDAGKIVLVAGFQGVNCYNDLTTLGRGASDTTAVAIAAVLGAQVCEIYSDQEGIFTSDPRIVPKARKIDELGYDDMLELAFSGVQMLHGRAVEMAKRYNVNVVVRSSMTQAPGTWIKEDSKVERLSVTGLAIDRGVARITVVGFKDEPGVAYKVFSLLAKEQIPVDIILQSVGVGFNRDICFTVHKPDLAAATSILAAHKEEIGYESLTTDENLAKLAVVGAGMATNFGIASAVFEALYENGINIEMINTSEIKLTVLVDENKVAKAANAIHDKFDHLHVFDTEEGVAQ
ncbi:MAG: aspartate kinase [Defluviitaleaceae bacterium]|nr:aspartate kinase [Defluviitaleaceae bacterium]